jgi:hypothetical protein
MQLAYNQQAPFADPMSHVQTETPSLYPLPVPIAGQPVWRGRVQATREFANILQGNRSLYFF